MRDMDKEPSLRRDICLAVQLAWSLGYIIALPAVLFGFSGAYLDKYFDTSPWLLLSSFAIAMIISTVGIRRRLQEISAGL